MYLIIYDDFFFKAVMTKATFIILYATFHHISLFGYFKTEILRKNSIRQALFWIILYSLKAYFCQMVGTFLNIFLSRLQVHWKEEQNCQEYGRTNREIPNGCSYLQLQLFVYSPLSLNM